MKTTITLHEEGDLYKIYKATSKHDADRFASFVGAQSITQSRSGIEILVLKRGHY